MVQMLMVSMYLKKKKNQNRAHDWDWYFDKRKRWEDKGREGNAKGLRPAEKNGKIKWKDILE